MKLLDDIHLGGLDFKSSFSTSFKHTIYQGTAFYLWFWCTQSVGEINPGEDQRLLVYAADRNGQSPFATNPFNQHQCVLMLFLWIRSIDSIENLQDLCLEMDLLHKWLWSAGNGLAGGRPWYMVRIVCLTYSPPISPTSQPLAQLIILSRSVHKVSKKFLAQVPCPIFYFLPDLALNVFVPEGRTGSYVSKWVQLSIAMWTHA